MKSKIGILGGTFDPIHNGHIELAKAALEEFRLDKIIFMPTGVSYMKTGVSPSEHRYEMCKLAISEYHDFEIDDEEIKREGNTYTYETLRYLKMKYPKAELYFIIGLDTLYTIDTWKNVSEVFKKCILLCADRLSAFSERDISSRISELESLYSAKISLLKMDKCPISSTEIRETIRNKIYDEKLLMQLPESVKAYILKNELYTRIDYLKREIKFVLKPKRYIHTMGVYETALKLAQKYGADIEKTAIAALLHDCAKNIPLHEMIEICGQFGIVLLDHERQSSALLHGKTGAVLSKIRYQIEDQEIYDAIYFHTTGKPDMSLILQIIFVADYIEPGRTSAPNLDILRKLAFVDLNQATALILKDTLDYLKNGKDKNIDEMTAKSFAFYQKYL